MEAEKKKRKKAESAAEAEAEAEKMLPGQMRIELDGTIHEEDEGEDEDAKKAEKKAKEKAKLTRLSKQIVDVMQSDKRTWVQIYRLMDAVETDGLWRAAEYHSFTAWASDLANKGRFQLRELWRYRKAGQYYAEYAERAAAKGIAVPDIESDDPEATESIAAAVSPRNVERIDKIAGNDVQERDRLIFGMIEGRLKAPELDAMWRTKKASGAFVRSSRHDTYTTDTDGKAEAEDSKEKATVTAADIVEALTAASDGAWLPEERKELTRAMLRHSSRARRNRKRYRVFTETPVHTGSTDHAARIDALIVETYGTLQLDEVFLHAVEIKVDKGDLLRDLKMEEYSVFADFMYLAVPDDPEMISLAEQKCDDLQGREQGQWGILAIKKPEHGGAPVLRVVRRPERLQGVMRDKTLAYLVHELI